MCFFPADVGQRLASRPRGKKNTLIFFFNKPSWVMQLHVDNVKTKEVVEVEVSLTFWLATANFAQKTLIPGFVSLYFFIPEKAVLVLMAAK